MSNIISNIEEAILALRPKLFDYLGIKLGINNPKKPFHCIFHDDNGRPNMILNPKDNYQTAHCFSCGTTADIFSFANRIENLPTNGGDWIKITLPALAEQLDIKLQLGEQSEAQKLRSLYMKLLQDTTNLLLKSEDLSYLKERGWSENTKGGSIDLEDLLNKLELLGWDKNYIKNTNLLCWKKKDLEGNFKEITLFSKEKYTLIIQDSYLRPVGFIARWKVYDQEIHDEKYIHSLNNNIFNKSKTLYGLTNIKEARQDGLYLFEGPGDVEAAKTKNLKNCAAVMGTAITEDQLLEIKKLGIKKVILCLDWDNAGREATNRIIDNVLPKITDLSFLIKDNSTSAKDPDDFFNHFTLEDWKKEKEISVFEYKLVKLSTELDIENLCKEMIPCIAQETSAIKRNLLSKQLSDFTGVDFASIEADVEAHRNIDNKEKRSSIVAAGQQFLNAIQSDPENAMSLIASFESDIEKIEKRFNKSSLGVNYQLQKYLDLQALRKLSTEDADAAMFKFTHFKEFASSFEGGMPLTRGCQIYIGGRANSGKTLSALALGTDVCLSDENAMVIVQTMDDAFERIEPRLKTNAFNMYYHNQEEHLTLDMVISPWKYRNNATVERALKLADELFIDLLGQEKLVIIDANDGPNLTTFERTLRYYRSRYPDKKLLTIQDNTHDLQDFPGLDQTTRMKMISAGQKHLTSKYNMCLMATTEYRKAPPGSNTKMILPTNDDIADSRAMSYKPDMIFHVYNDLADRGEENAEIFWTANGKKFPRLLWVVTKNKINSFKGKLVNDIDPSAVMLYPKSTEQAAQEWENQFNIPKENQDEMNDLDHELTYEIETEWKEE